MAMFKQDAMTMRPGEMQGLADAKPNHSSKNHSSKNHARQNHARQNHAVQTPLIPDPRQLAPLLAGAWARGVADSLEMLGQGAILLDASGAMLFASERAKELLKGQFDLVSQHIVGREGKANQALDAMIAHALAGKQGELRFETAESTLTIRAYAAPALQAPQVQLLQVVLAIS